VDIGAAHSVKDLNKVILPNYEIILNAVKVTYVTLIERCQKGRGEGNVTDVWLHHGTLYPFETY
jgi:hypothetical protein